MFCPETACGHRATGVSVKMHFFPSSSKAGQLQTSCNLVGLASCLCAVDLCHSSKFMGTSTVYSLWTDLANLFYKDVKYQKVIIMIKYVTEYLLGYSETPSGTTEIALVPL